MKDVVSSGKVCIGEEPQESAEKRQDEQINKPLRDLMEIIHFTENVSAKIHGVLDEAEVYRIVKEEFAKSKRYNVSVFLLTDDGTKLMLMEASLSPEKRKVGEKVLRIRSYKGYKFDLDKSSSFSRVVKEGETIEANFIDVACESFPRPLAYLITKAIGYEKRSGILTPLKRHGKIIGILVIDSTELAKHFIPSVKNLAQHISTALELADEYAVRKKAQDALKESEELYRSLVELAPDVIITLNLKGVITSCNVVAARASSYSKDEMVGKHFSKLGFLRVKNIPKYAKMFSSIMRGKVPEPFETAWRAKDGSEHIDEVRLGLMKKGDRIIGIQAITRDITERKQMEKELRESENRYRTIFEGAGDGILVANPETTRFAFANPQICRLTGHSKEELLKLSVEDIHPKKDLPQVMEQFKKLAQGKITHVEGIPVLRKDKSVIYCDLNATHLQIGKQNLLAGFFRDISERRKTEQALRESEEKYRNLFENAQDVNVTLNLEGKITSVNRAVQKYGYDRNELVGESVLDLIPEEERQGRQRNLRELAQGRSTESEFKIKTKNKSGYIIVETKSNPIFQDGKVIGAQSIMRDITERKEMEEKLGDSEEKFRAITSSANDAILLIDDEGKFSYWNPAAEKMFGHTQEEVSDKKMYELITPKRFREGHISGFGKFKKTGKGRIIGKTVEMAAIRKGGTEFPVEFSLSGLQVKGKHYALAIVRDITERKKMEEKLKHYSEHLEELVQKRTAELLESEKRYSVLVEEASDGVAIIQDGKLVLTNKKGPQIVDYPKDEVIGLPFEKLVDEKYRQYAIELYFGRLRGEQAPATAELELIAKTGKRVPVEIGGTLIHYQGRPAVLVIMRDIRERKRIEEQRSKLEKLATIGELATMVAHDIRNPLTSIRNANYYIRNSCPHRANVECKTASEMLDIIEQETLFANDIINDLLDFAAKRPLQKKKQNINNPIDDSLTRMHMPQNINIKRKYAKKATVAVDEKQLERVFLNLTKNAVQAMPNGGTLTITTNETKDHIEIVFTDTGTGIPEENMDSLFSPLFTTKAKGIGMGLAICRKIVEQHCGTIEAQSKVGQGTTFTIKLPKKEETNAQ